MIVLPAIDLYEKKAVRLYKGDYSAMTVYSADPVAVAAELERLGAEYVHMVDLEGARDGATPNLPVIERVAGRTALRIEAGGGIRDMESVDRYFAAGVARVILGTAAVNDESLLRAALEKYGAGVAVGADVRDGFIAVKGWVESSAYTLEAFLDRLARLGVKTVICTDISRDGALGGANLALYGRLTAKYAMDIIASGGVSDFGDVTRLRDMGMAGAIIGKAYYTGAIDLGKAIEAAR